MAPCTPGPLSQVATGYFPLTIGSSVLAIAGYDETAGQLGSGGPVIVTFASSSTFTAQRLFRPLIAATIGGWSPSAFIDNLHGLGPVGNFPLKTGQGYLLYTDKAASYPVAASAGARAAGRVEAARAGSTEWEGITHRPMLPVPGWQRLRTTQIQRVALPLRTQMGRAPMRVQDYEGTTPLVPGRGS